MSQNKKKVRKKIRPQTTWPVGEDDPAFNTLALAKALDKSPRTLERWRGDGTGPAFVKVGKTPLYRQSAVRRWMEEQTRTFTNEEG